MNKIRLLRLANHLEGNKLAHVVFNFRLFNAMYDRGGSIMSSSEVGNRCGTSGCALGECPSLFGKDWSWAGNNVVYKRSYNMEAAKMFFGLTETQAEYLFYPTGLGHSLPDDATKEQVADRIRRFVRRNGRMG